MPDQAQITVAIDHREIRISRYHRQGFKQRVHEYEIRNISAKNQRRVSQILKAFKTKSVDFEDGEVIGWWATPAPVYAQEPATDPRPPIGAIVQARYGKLWDYTGEVTRHHAVMESGFYVFWHKWNRTEDNATLSGWEYSMNNCRVITSPVPGQWWPEGRK